MSHCNDPRCPDHGAYLRKPKSTGIPGSNWLAVLEVCESDLSNIEKVRRIYRIAAQVVA